MSQDLKDKKVRDIQRKEILVGGGKSKCQGPVVGKSLAYRWDGAGQRERGTRRAWREKQGLCGLEKRVVSYSKW